MFYRCIQSLAHLCIVLTVFATPYGYSSEIKYLQTNSNSPDAESKDRFTRHTIDKIQPPGNDGAIWFNGTDREYLLEVTLVAPELLFDPADSEALLNQYDEVENLRSLVIETQALTIRGELNLHGTKLRIHAKTIHFDGDEARIITDPIETDYKPENALRHYNGGTKTPAGNGLAGEDAGDIYLLAEQITPDDDMPRFYMRGTDGQRGGSGHAGTEPEIDKFQTILDGRYTRKHHPDDDWLKNTKWTVFNQFKINKKRQEQRDRNDAFLRDLQKLRDNRAGFKNHNSFYNTFEAYMTPIPHGYAGPGGSAGDVGGKSPRIY